MKIRTRLTLLFTAILVISFAVCGAFSVQYFMNGIVSSLAKGERERLSLSERAFRQAGSREDFSEMGETARDAYLKYQFRQCYGDGFALLSGDSVLLDLTGYTLVDPGALSGQYAVQKLGARYLLITKQPLSYPEGFAVLSVRDISSAWTDGLLQLKWYLLLFFGVLLFAVLAVYVFTGYLLRTLQALRAQADEISRGEFSGRVAADGRDELSQLGQSFNRMSEQIEAQIAQLRLLLGALAHETKTPVTSVLGYADTLLHVNLDAVQRERCLLHLRTAALRLDCLNGKLMQLIGLYQNEAISFEEISLPALLETVRNDFSGEAAKLSAAIQIFVCEPPAFISGDEQLLYSLFSNLVSNSLKALRTDGSGQILIELFSDRVRISDNGCGIPKEALAHVRDAFYQVDKSEKQKGHHFGLGLALCERICRLHGFSLEIESAENTGTRVDVHFTKR